MTKQEEIMCSKCNGTGFLDSIPNGSSTVCPDCYGQKKVIVRHEAEPLIKGE